MAQDLIVNGVTYPAVEAMEMTTAAGEKIVFYPDAVRYNQQTLTEEQKAQARQNIGAASAVDIEPREDDIPLIFFGSALPQTKDEVVMPIRYVSKTADFSGYCETKAQGNSSMAYPKKNQTTKFFADEACSEKKKINFRGWGKQNKFCLKANWIDFSHARNVVSARLWADIIKSRPDYNSLPEQMRTSPNQGAVDGFPVKVYADGIYQGRYTLNIPKDKWMANMDDNLEDNVILCSENYVSGCFRAPALINGSDWSDEIHDIVPESIKTRWNEIINFVMNSTDAEFEAGIGSRIDLTSLLDYYLFGMASCGLDAFGKNQLYYAWSGTPFYAMMYDMDSTWGNHYTGQHFVSVDYFREQFQDMVDGEGNLLLIRVVERFAEQLKARWAVLRKGPLSIENIAHRFEEFAAICPPWMMAEDYAATTAGGAFTKIPQVETNNLAQIRNYAAARLKWADEYVANLDQRIPCTSITLSASALTFKSVGEQTLVATLQPANTTDKVVWSTSNAGVVTVSDGVVTVVDNGDAVITAKCGDKIATCSVNVSGVGEEDTTILYALPAETAFNGSSDYIDTGLQLTAKDIDYTILLTAVGHHANEASAKVFENSTGCRMYRPGGSGGRYAIEAYGGAVTTNILQDGSTAATTVFRVAISHVAGSNKFVVRTAYGNEIADEITKAFSYNWETRANTLMLGAQKVNGNISTYWRGTMYEFRVHNYAMSSEELLAYVQG